MSSATKVAIAASAAFLLAVTAAEAQTRASRWLDARPVANWNEPGAAIPRGPDIGAAGDVAECEKRSGDGAAAAAQTPEARQVSAAGWLGAKVETRVGDTTVVFARNGVDGMCRPMAYQYFVFVRGRFAGTLSPRPMDSRTDGAGYVDENPGEKRLTATFARYRDSDPLCCPSRISTVVYEIREAGGAPLVAPVSVATKTTQQ